MNNVQKYVVSDSLSDDDAGAVVADDDHPP